MTGSSRAATDSTQKIQAPFECASIGLDIKSYRISFDDRQYIIETVKVSARYFSTSRLKT